MSATITSSMEDLSQTKSPIISSSSTTTTTTTIHPLSYTNLLSNTDSYFTNIHDNHVPSQSNKSSTHSSSPPPSIDLTKPIKPSPSPPPSIDLTKPIIATKPTINIPNYYVPPKQTVIQQQPQQEETITPQPPRLVRKKSGELVKSSLKFPSTLLHRSISSPNIINQPTFSSSSSSSSSSITSPKRKSVKFASILTNIKTFDGCDSPNVVSSPLQSPSNEEYIDDDYLYLKTNHFFDYEYDYDVTTKDDFSWSTPKSFNQETKQKYIHEYRLINHNIPKLLNTESVPIYLFSAYVLKTNGKSYLYGLINVKNLAFEKKLTIKLTKDNWATSLIFNGGTIIQYNRSINSNLDQFKFKICLDDILYQTEQSNDQFSNLEICFKLEINNMTIWDNNNQQNYKFKLKNIKVEQQTPPFSQFNEVELVSKLNKLNLSNSNARPPMMKSFSDLNLTSNKLKYSHRQKNKSSPSPLSNSNSKISHLSYDDLLKKYCFSNNTNTNSTKVNLIKSCAAPSTASTLYSFSDQVHT